MTEDVGPLLFVVGDPIIDRYIEGHVAQVAPDAPVLVLRETGGFTKAGGAWNTALNVRGAGIDPILCTVIGHEEEALRIQTENFDPERVFSLHVEGWKTQLKTRYLGQFRQQLFRSDIPKNAPLGDEATDRFVRIIGRASRGYGKTPNVVLVCDYGCGVVGPTLIPSLRARFPEACIIVDPYPTTPPHWYDGADLVKLNEKEWKGLDLDEHRRSGRHLVDFIKHVVVTYAGDAVKVMGAEEFEVKPPERELVDPCGAGDTFAAYLAVAMASGKTLRDSVREAAVAGAVSVSRKGVAVITRDEVEAALATCS